MYTGTNSVTGGKFWTMPRERERILDRWENVWRPHERAYLVEKCKEVQHGQSSEGERVSVGRWGRGNQQGRTEMKKECSEKLIWKR